MEFPQLYAQPLGAEFLDIVVPDEDAARQVAQYLRSKGFECQDMTGDLQIAFKGQPFIVHEWLRVKGWVRPIFATLSNLFAGA